MKEEWLELFKLHVCKYDLKDENISRKYFHSINVMNLCEEIATRINLEKNDIKYISLIGLLHDYSRFEQLSKFKTFSDKDSCDHAELAAKRLFDENEIQEYDLPKSYYELGKKTIYNHNKYQISDNLSEREKTFCDIVRDADKIDIFDQLANNKKYIEEDEGIINEKLIIEYLKRKSLNQRFITNKNEKLLLIIAMIFDLKYYYSFKIIKEKDYLNKMYDRISNKELYKKYIEIAKRYVKEQLNN